HEIRIFRVVYRDETMVRQQGLDFPPHEEFDPTEQDRRHAGRLKSVDAAFKRGIEEIRAGRYFEAHEELETAWRAAPAEERDFYQGLVHVAVAWYQARRGRPVATASQLAKAASRLGPFAPSHRG